MNILERYSCPTRYTQEEKGVVWHATLQQDVKVTYIQVGDFETPHWVHMGEFLDTIYRSKYNDPSWINKMMKLYENPE